MAIKRVSTRPPFERTALLLQGGGALGSYQAGVYQALAEADLHPDWVAGISIGAINSALIIGNAPEQRVEKLRAFWEQVSQPPMGVPYFANYQIESDLQHQLINQWRSLGTLMWGVPGFFQPRFPPPLALPAGDPGNLAYYDISPLRSLLEKLIDFDRINAKQQHFSVGAVNVKTGNFTYFDNQTHRIGPQHVMAMRDALVDLATVRPAMAKATLKARVARPAGATAHVLSYAPRPH